MYQMRLFDYYELRYHVKIDCNYCEGKGLKWFTCLLCKGNGYTTDCKAWRAVGVRNCKGSGRYKLNCINLEFAKLFII